MSPVAQSPKALVPGEVFGRYAIEGLLGTGGMARVYEARDSALHRVVALKILHEPGEDDFSTPATGGSERIVREARALAALEHPNVVAVYDVGVVADGKHAGTAYLTMELVRGRSLRAVMADAPAPLDVRVRWLRDAARGLAAAHACGVIHRDVKPENILVRADGVVKVLDFGIAKSATLLPATTGQIVAPDGPLATLTGEGLVLGTPYYMSPEQMRGERLDARSDQFSWGVVAYQMLAGVAPWGEGIEAVNVIANVLSKKPPSARTKNPAVPTWLADVIDRALAKDPDARFPSMSEVVDALDQHALTESPTEVLTEPVVGARAGAIVLVRRVAITVAAISVLALVVGGLAKLRGKEDIVPSPSVAASVLAAPSAAPAAVSDAALGDTVTRSETVLDTKTVDASAGLLVKKTPKTRDRNAPKSAPTSRIDPFGDQK